MGIIIRRTAAEKVEEICCFWCGHARVETPKGRVLRGTDTSRDFICSACSAWVRKEAPYGTV